LGELRTASLPRAVRSRSTRWEAVRTGMVAGPCVRHSFSLSPGWERGELCAGWWHPFTVLAARRCRNQSIAAARLAHVADHAVAAGRRVGPAHPLRFLVSGAGDDLVLHDLARGLVTAVAEGVHHEAVLIDGRHGRILSSPEMGKDG